MSKKTIIILVTAIILVVIAVILSSYAFFIRVEESSEEPKYELNLDEESNTEDIENSGFKPIVLSREDGTELTDKDLEGKPVAIVFFDKNNEDSMKVLDKVEKMYSTYSDKIEFLVVNDAKEIDNDLKGKYSFEIYYDFYEETTRNYMIKNYPSMVYMNKSRDFINAKSGYTSDDALEANLDIISENF